MTEKQPPRRSPARVGVLTGVIGYLVGAVVMVLAILRSPSSTAAIGLLLVPFLAVLPGTLALILGGTGAYLWQWSQTAGRRWSAGVVTAAAAFIVLGGGSAWYVARSLLVGRAVDQVVRMDAVELSEYFQHGSLRGDKFVLGAVAQNGAADRALLDAIAHLDDKSLHAGMGSLFPLLGENRRGLAVMRLVARHDNTGTETLRWLAHSPDFYVLGDVAGNAKTPVEVLRRLHTKGGYLIEWGLARNPRTPVEFLHELAASENQYTRTGVARNPATPTADLDRLGDDTIWHVRRNVAGNKATSKERLARLANDANEQVRNAARRRVEAGAGR